VTSLSLVCETGGKCFKLLKAPNDSGLPLVPPQKTLFYATVHEIIIHVKVCDTLYLTPTLWGPRTAGWMSDAWGTKMEKPPGVLKSSTDWLYSTGF